MVKHIKCGYKCKFNSITCNSNRRWNNDKCQYECKNYLTCKKFHIWSLNICIYENGKYLKIIADTSVITSDKIINATDSVWTNVTHSIPTNLTSTVSIMLKK